MNNSSGIKYKMFPNPQKSIYNSEYRDPNKFYYNNRSYTIIDDIEDTSSKNKSNKDSSDNYNHNTKNPKKIKKETNLPICKSTSLSVKKNIITENFDIFYGFEVHKITLCSSCLRWKLPRTHHCRSCGKCILKMDHHCPWLANCIGFNNYKFFCLMIFYGFFLSMTVFITFWEVVLNYLYSSETDVISTTIVCLCYSFNFGLLVFLSYLANYNCSLIYANETIIERSDRERFMEGVNVNPNYISMSNHISYDKGFYRNFTEVFGTNCLFWLLPFKNNYEYIKSFIN